ncbi:hypothetical protein H6F72_12065 [Trichocoleus sp. FACHB-46]|nr:hypothetical protein [Trichocoleus sp. FACHB-46]
MTTTPNYGALLQSFWALPTISIEEHPDSAGNNPSEPTNIIKFLGEDLLWQQTIPAKEPDSRVIYSLSGLKPFILKESINHWKIWKPDQTSLVRDGDAERVPRLLLQAECKIVQMFADYHVSGRSKRCVFARQATCPVAC